jgi:hypothetical protein
LTIARPSVWRCEFQQVENANMKRGASPDSVRVAALAPLIVYPCSETHKAARPSGFAPTLFARLFVMTMSPRFAQRPFAIQLLLQPTQGFFHRLTFF